MKVKDNWDINTSIHSRNRLSINAKARLSLLIAMVGILRTFFLIKFKKKQQAAFISTIGVLCGLARNKKEIY
jgi:hypothetical protein